MAQRGWLRHDVNQERTRGTTTLDFRFVFFLGIGNLFVAGRQFYIVNLLLPGLIVELGAAFLGLPDHFRKPVLRFVVGRLLVHGNSIHASGGCALATYGRRESRGSTVG